jgi:cytochrome P450
LSAGLITNTAYVLLRHPGERAQILASPTLIDAAVERRLGSGVPRRRSCDGSVPSTSSTETCSSATSASDLLAGSANRDPDRFEDPDRILLERQRNQHLGFGHGPHYCLGASLARAETQVAVGTVIRRLPKLALSGGELRWRPQLLTRGWQALPVSY